MSPTSPRYAVARTLLTMDRPILNDKRPRSAGVWLKEVFGYPCHRPSRSPAHFSPSSQAALEQSRITHKSPMTQPSTGTGHQSSNRVPLRVPGRRSVGISECERRPFVPGSLSDPGSGLRSDSRVSIPHLLEFLANVIEAQRPFTGPPINRSIMNRNSALFQMYFRSRWVVVWIGQCHVVTSEHHPARKAQHVRIP